MPYSRFEHEQQLLDCWNVTKDLQTVLEAIEDITIPTEHTDRLQNMLIGMIALYDAKFDKLFKQFEQSIGESSR